MRAENKNESPAEKYGFTPKTRLSTVERKLKEGGWSDDRIRGYIRGWTATSKMQK